jgi:hypothetical protein
MSEELKIKTLINTSLKVLNLIEKLSKLDALNIEQEKTLNLNKEHIKLMLDNPEFKKSCTKTQLKKFNDIIKN